MMKKLWQGKGKLAFFSIPFFLFLSIGILLVSCGKDPQLKVLDAEKGPFALFLPAGRVLLNPGSQHFGFIGLSDPREPSEELSSGFGFKDTSFTVEAWIKPEEKNVTPNADVADIRLVGLIATGGELREEAGSAAQTLNGYALYLWEGDGTSPFGCDDTATLRCLKFAIKSNGIWYTATGIADLGDGEWHHVAGVFDKDAGTLTVYVDGIKITGGVGHPNPQTGVSAPSGHGPTYIGGSQAFPSVEGETLANSEFLAFSIHYLKGSIDEVRLWNVARSEAEINQCMKKELQISGDCPIKPDILGTYLKFNEGEGATLSDSSGNGNNGAAQFYQNIEGEETLHEWTESNPDFPITWMEGYTFQD